MSFWFTNEWVQIIKTAAEGEHPRAYEVAGQLNSAIDKKTCDRIKSLGIGKDNWIESKVEEEKRLTGRKPEYEKNTKARMSDIHWTTEQWLCDLIWPFMLEANKGAGWNLDISAAEPMQITRYKKGGFYAWHKDGNSDSLSAYDRPESPLLHGKVRKISMSLILNDNFEGGDLEFASYGREKCIITPIKVKAGDMIFFTSGMEHRVAPVTKGTRYSLVNWFCGPPIR